MIKPVSYIIRFSGDLMYDLLKKRYRKLFTKHNILMGYGELNGFFFLRLTIGTKKDRLVTFAVTKIGRKITTEIKQDIELDDVDAYLLDEFKKPKKINKEIKKEVEKIKEGEKKDEKITP